MQSPIPPTRAPVKRERAEWYLLLMLVGFAASVILTRSFLALTGYPQLGSGQLHIAHVLWGGLLLFVAALLPLVLSNRWALSVGAVSSGVGVGLFIDEVGKFVTASNDYFYPPAAAIIYAFFLLTVLLYLQVRRPSSRNPRAELYRLLDGLTEVLDHDLEPQERAALEARLRHVAREPDYANLAQLATAMLDFLDTEELQLARASQTFLQRLAARADALAMRLFSRRRLKALLVVSLGVSGLLALLEAGALLVTALAPGSFWEDLVSSLVVAGEVRTVNEVIWFLVRVVVEAGVGALSVVAAGFLVGGRERRGIAIAVLSLLLSLTAVNLLVFYLDQFRATFGALLQFGLLRGAIVFRRSYLD